MNAPEDITAALYAGWRGRMARCARSKMMFMTPASIFKVNFYYRIYRNACWVHVGNIITGSVYKVMNM